MTDDRMNLSLITEMLDTLDRHGYTRGDNEHTARAIVLISDLAHIYEGSLDHPFGPYINEVQPQAESAPPEQVGQDTVVLPARELSTIVAALDEASLYKRDRAATCADCADQSCGTCQWRLQAAQTYDSLAVQLVGKRRPPGPQPPNTPGPPASHSPQQTGRPASDPTARRQLTQPKAPRLRDRRRRQRLAPRPLPGRHSLPDRCPARRPEPPPRPRTRPGSRTMTLTIHDTTMTSDQTAHTAQQALSRNGWEVSWLPGQILDRNSAITAMILADITAEEDLHEDHRLWPHIQGWAAELGLTGPEAVAAASQPPGDISRQHGRADGQPGREAAD